MFNGYARLSLLPDISNWDISNVTNMSSMLADCTSLISLPDISKWNTPNLKIVYNIFCNYKSLISKPNI